MSRTVKRIAVLLLTVGWMLTIFLYSAMPAEESMRQSDGIVTQLIRIFVNDFDELPLEEQAEWIDGFSMLVRKGAHMAEYAILSGLIYATLSVWQWNKGYPVKGLTAWGAASVYAVTDELHQRFVPGRSGVPIDVLIDSIGAFIGIVLAMGIACWLASRRQNCAIKESECGD